MEKTNAHQNFDYKPSKESPAWMHVAFKEIGQKEKKDGDNERIIEYGTATSLSAKTDEVPWCSSFVCWCLEQCKIKSTRSAWARSYLTFGQLLDKPKEGAICVFSRGKESGHVGFFIKEEPGLIYVLGGNQGNSVGISAYPKKNLLKFRYPPVGSLH